MKITKGQFDSITASLSNGLTAKQAAQKAGTSDRIAQRVREAGTWERWPYIVAKATHGYNTPEYKTYLKRRGLPLTPPSKVPYTQGAGRSVNITSDELLDDTTHDGSHWYRLKRWFGWGK